MHHAQAHSARRWLAALLVTLAAVAGFGLLQHPAASSAAVPPGEIDPLTVTDPIVSHRDTFQMPSGRIACGYSVYAHKSYLGCEFRYVEGDSTAPRKVEGQTITKVCKENFPDEWGNGATLTAKGKATVNCASGVTVPVRHPKVLQYDTRWSRGKYVCLSRSDALRCSTKSGAHGFRLDKDLVRVW